MSDPLNEFRSGAGSNAKPAARGDCNPRRGCNRQAAGRIWGPVLVRTLS